MLRQHPGIWNLAVVLRQEEAEKRLIAYLVTRRGASPESLPGIQEAALDGATGLLPVPESHSAIQQIFSFSQ